MPGEEAILGPHIFGRGEEYLRGKMKDGDNREFAIEYLRSTGKTAINTFFIKPDKGKATYKEMNVPAKDAPLYTRKIRRVGPMLY